MNDSISNKDNLSGANLSEKSNVEEATDRELAIYSLRYAPKDWLDGEE